MTRLKDLENFNPDTVIQDLGLEKFPIFEFDSENWKTTLENTFTLTFQFTNIHLTSLDGKGVPECRNWHTTIVYNFASLHSVSMESKFGYTQCSLPTILNTNRKSEEDKIIFKVKSIL